MCPQKSPSPRTRHAVAESSRVERLEAELLHRRAGRPRRPSPRSSGVARTRDRLAVHARASRRPWPRRSRRGRGRGRRRRPPRRRPRGRPGSPRAGCRSCSCGCRRSDRRPMSAARAPRRRRRRSADRPPRRARCGRAAPRRGGPRIASSAARSASVTHEPSPLRVAGGMAAVALERDPAAQERELAGELEVGRVARSHRRAPPGAARMRRRALPGASRRRGRATRRSPSATARSGLPPDARPWPPAARRPCRPARPRRAAAGWRAASARGRARRPRAGSRRRRRPRRRGRSRRSGPRPSRATSAAIRSHTGSPPASSASCTSAPPGFEVRVSTKMPDPSPQAVRNGRSESSPRYGLTVSASPAAAAPSRRCSQASA